MIGVFVRSFFMISLIGWYSASVWKTMDAYFRDEFKKYLAKERESTDLMEKNVVSSNEKLEAIQHLYEQYPDQDRKRDENQNNINQAKTVKSLKDSQDNSHNKDSQSNINDGQTSIIQNHLADSKDKNQNGYQKLNMYDGQISKTHIDKSKYQLHTDWISGTDDEYCSMEESTQNENECNHNP